MEINVKKNGGLWVVSFTHGVQTFTLDYHVTTKKEAEWMKSMLAKCFASAFGENWNDDSGLSKHAVKGSFCDCENPKYGYTQPVCFDCRREVKVD